MKSAQELLINEKQEKKVRKSEDEKTGKKMDQLAAYGSDGVGSAQRLRQQKGHR